MAEKSMVLMRRERRETLTQYATRMFVTFRRAGVPTMITPNEAQNLAKPYGVVLRFAKTDGDCPNSAAVALASVVRRIVTSSVVSARVAKMIAETGKADG